MDESTSINRGELYAALAMARLKFSDLAKSKEVKTNTYSYKYADLAAIIEATAAPLAEQGLSLIQEPEVTNDGGKMLVIVHGTIVHKSGAEYRLLPLPLPVQQTTPQGIGSAISYARRYQIQAALNLAADDDDGQDATKKPAATTTQPQRTQPAVHRNGAPKPAASKAQTPEDVIASWKSSADMLNWAVEMGGCENVHEAKNSWKKLVDAEGGSVTADNRNALQHKFFYHQMEKAAAKAPATLDEVDAIPA